MIKKTEIPIKKPEAIKTQKTTFAVAKKTISAPKEKTEPKNKSVGSLIQNPKIQTAEGWIRTHSKKRKKAE